VEKGNKLLFFLKQLMDLRIYGLDGGGALEW